MHTEAAPKRGPFMGDVASAFNRVQRPRLAIGWTESDDPSLHLINGRLGRRDQAGRV